MLGLGFQTRNTLTITNHRHFCVNLRSIMKKKIIFALAAIGMGMGLATTATANTNTASGLCTDPCGTADYYCNHVGNDELCKMWVRNCIACGGTTEQ